jgi:glycosyltransferase involved in cell wall biosynthesis
MESSPEFTVLAPVNRPPDLLPFAVRSVLGQSRQDFELFIICDGAPSATVEAARRFEAEDPRVRAFVHPKGERHGEAWRHLALQEAHGHIVCQIGDDDLWFPDHLAEIAALMASADFGNTLPLLLQPRGTPTIRLGDLADPDIQRMMLGRLYNLFGPTTAAYRLEAYRALPIGWSPAPEGVWTDLWMWRKFLALPGLRLRTWFKPTTLGFPAGSRQDWTMDWRREEIGAHAVAIQSQDSRDRLVRDALAATGRERTGLLIQRGVMLQTRQTLLAAVEDAERALTEIAAAADGSEAQTRLAQAALAQLPDRAWRASLAGSPIASPSAGAPPEHEQG